MFPLFAEKHVPVASVIRDKMTDEQRQELGYCIVEVARSFNIKEAAIQLPLLQTNALLKRSIVDTVDSFVHKHI